jgi:hypothetical protein
MNYKELCNDDKIAAIFECNFWRSELAAIEQYIVALQTNNRTVIEDFETFGDWPQQIAQNMHLFSRAYTVYGFTRIAFSEHGWLEREEFMNVESFNFGGGIKGNIGRNSITVGHSPNNKWTHGMYLAAPKSGSAYGLSVFNNPYASRSECLRVALTAMIEWHKKEDDRRTVPIIKEAQDMLDEIMGRKPKQLSLF